MLAETSIARNQNEKRFKVGLIGQNIGQSLTPAMHMREGQELGLDYHYQLIDLAENHRSPNDLEQLIAQAEMHGFAGLNITHPCKQAAVALVDKLSSHARTLQSINTIVFDQGKRVGHNTDWWGYAESFKYNFADMSLNHVVLLGAGGAGVAVAYALAEMGAEKITIYDLDQEKIEALVATIKQSYPACDVQTGRDLQASLSNASGLVNATPVGMDAHPGLPLDAGLLSAHYWVSDIVYFPLQTPLIKRAQHSGCRVLTGGGMAVFQAVGAFELFTGLSADRQRMLAHFQLLQEMRVTTG